jgi:hypothetical protein
LCFVFIRVEKKKRPAQIPSRRKKDEQIKVKMKQIEHSADRPHYTEKEEEEERRF